MIFAGICLITNNVKRLSAFYQTVLQTTSDSDSNTRATAIFIIKYLKTFGFNVSNDALPKIRGISETRSSEQIITIWATALPPLRSFWGDFLKTCCSEKAMS